MKKHVFVIILIFTILFAEAQQNNGVYSFDKTRNTVELDITKIFHIERRIHILYALSQDDRFSIAAIGEDGIFAINTSKNNTKTDLYADFTTFFEEEEAAYNSMTKEKLGDAYLEWKAQLPENFVASIMMDYYVNNRQNNLCAHADPFCTDNGLYMFPAGTNAGSGETGPNYNCLHSTPNPAWYYMRIDNPGGISIYMYSEPGEDIDFCAWGPFDDPVASCPNGLTSDKVVSCSYSSSATETCAIPGSAQTGEYYILVITNYSNHECNINFSKVGGNGTTDCSIMPPMVWYENACYGSNLTLHAQEVNNATYSWTGPNGFTSTEMEPTINNITFNNSGTYECSITVGTQTSDPMSIDVNVIPNLNLTIDSPSTVSVGVNTMFTGNVTTSPSGHDNAIVEWDRTWDFGDGTGTETGQTVTHTFNAMGTYTVTHTVIARNDAGESCQVTETKQITVDQVSAYITANDYLLCEGESTTLMVNLPNGAGSFTYSWQPSNMIEGSNTLQEVTTKPLTQTTAFTCTLTDAYGNSFTTPQTAIMVKQYPVTNLSVVNPILINNVSTTILGSTVTLLANAYQGADYTWEPASMIYNIIEPWKVVVKPEQIGETTFHVTIDDSGCVSEEDIVIKALPPVSNTSITASEDVVCEDAIITLSATSEGGCGEYTYYWEPSEWIDGSNTMQTVTTKALKNDITFTCTATDKLIPNSTNSSDSGSKQIDIHNKPSVDSQLIGLSNVIPGIGYMPYVYEYSINEESLSGYDIENAEFTWEIYSYYDTPNHIPGTTYESSWAVYPDENNPKKAYVYVDNYGNSLLICTITSICGSAQTKKFIYTDGYEIGMSVDENNYDNLINIFPNPSNGDIYIDYEGIASPLTISILSYNGILIDQFKADSESKVMRYSMNGVANGLYFIKISGNDFVVTKKFVLSK